MASKLQRTRPSLACPPLHPNGNLAANRSIRHVQKSGFVFAECRRVPPIGTVYRRRCHRLLAHPPARVIDVGVAAVQPSTREALTGELSNPEVATGCAVVAVGVVGAGRGVRSVPPDRAVEGVVTDIDRAGTAPRVDRFGQVAVRVIGVGLIAPVGIGHRRQPARGIKRIGGANRTARLDESKEGGTSFCAYAWATIDLCMRSMTPTRSC